MATDEQQIRDLISTWMKATVVGDLSKILSLMTEDVVFLTPGQPPMRGKETFADGFRTASSHFRIDPASEIQEIHVMGSWAYCWNYLTVTMTPLKGGLPTRRTGHTLTVFRRDPTRGWLLSRDANMVAPEGA